MKILWRAALAVPLLALGQAIFAEAETDRLSALLAGYLANDLQLQKASISAQSAALSISGARISNGISVSVSSGTITIYSTSEGTSVEMKPSATLSMPAANDTSVSANVPVTVRNSANDKASVRNASVSVSTGIITDTPLTKRISVIEAERAYLEARRAVRSRAISAEKDFYSSLKNLYNNAVSVLGKRSDLYDDSISLRALQAQGYSTSSATYRKARMKVQSDQRDVREAERTFERETALFARKCGQKFERQTDSPYDNAIAFLPFDIPEVTPLNPRRFSRSTYTALESAHWSTYIADLRRKADKDMTLRANIGYTFNNSYSNSDTVDGGLSLDWKGFSASAGVSLSTGTNALGSDDGKRSHDPIYTLSFGWVPNTWRLSKISGQQDELDMQQEQLAIKMAADDYQSDMMDKMTSIDDIRWAKRAYAEEYEMYSQLEQDMSALYRQGIVTESEWLDARDNRDKTQINQLINAIDVIIFNDEIKLMFHTDEEPQG